MAHLTKICMHLLTYIFKSQHAELLNLGYASEDVKKSLLIQMLSATTQDFACKNS